jgi:PGF-CTERM protein
MFFKIGDTPVSELRYYPFVIRVLGNETMTTIPEEEGNVTEAPEENVTEEGNITETPEEEVTEMETTEEETTTEATLANETEGGEDSPGFGLVLGLIGLLAVVYFFRRNN